MDAKVVCRRAECAPDSTGIAVSDVFERFAHLRWKFASAAAAKPGAKAFVEIAARTASASLDSGKLLRRLGFCHTQQLACLAASGA